MSAEYEYHHAKAQQLEPSVETLSEISRSAAQRVVRLTDTHGQTERVPGKHN